MLFFRVRSHRSSGFTLLELLLVLAMVAILVSLAVPNYRRVMAQRAVDRAASQLRDHMELARTYAQTHQTRVTVCPVADNQLDAANPLCISNTSNWQAWVVKTDREVLARSQHSTKGVFINGGQNDKIVFNERGGANGYADSIIVEQNKVAKWIVVASDGRIQLLNEKIQDRSTATAAETSMDTDPPVSTMMAPIK